VGNKKDLLSGSFFVVWDNGRFKEHWTLCRLVFVPICRMGSGIIGGLCVRNLIITCYVSICEGGMIIAIKRNNGNFVRERCFCTILYEMVMGILNP